jgi:hypothetical protein
MKFLPWSMASLVLLAAFSDRAHAQNLAPNGDFEELQVDDLGQPTLDDYGNEAPLAWFRSQSDPATFPVPGTELISPGNMNNSAGNNLGDDSDGVGTNSIALNFLEDPDVPMLGVGVDWRSEGFDTVPGEMLIFSIDVKFIGVAQDDASGLFEGALAQVRSFTDQAPDGGTGGAFKGETNVTLQSKDFTPNEWHRVTQSLFVPAEGEWTDIRISSNLFIPPSPLFGGQILFDHVTVMRLSADFDGNAVVDAADLQAWKDAFGPGPGADADGDGDSDGADFLAWQQQLGLGATAAAAVRAVPEPAAGALAAVAVAAAVAYRRRARRA